MTEQRLTDEQIGSLLDALSDAKDEILRLETELDDQKLLLSTAHDEIEALLDERDKPRIELVYPEGNDDA